MKLRYKILISLLVAAGGFAYIGEWKTVFSGRKTVVSVPTTPATCCNPYWLEWRFPYSEPAVNPMGVGAYYLPPCSGLPLHANGQGWFWQGLPYAGQKPCVSHFEIHEMPMGVTDPHLALQVLRTETSAGLPETGDMFKYSAKLPIPTVKLYGETSWWRICTAIDTGQLDAQGNPIINGNCDMRADMGPTSITDFMKSKRIPIPPGVTTK